MIIMAPKNVGSAMNAYAIEIVLRVDDLPIRPENKDRYPKDWKLRSYFIRHYRAKWKCEWCGADNGYPHPITGSIVVLTVAHIYDDRPEASNLLNLAALCQLCHNRHDAKKRQQNRKQRLRLGSKQMEMFG